MDNGPIDIAESAQGMRDDVDSIVGDSRKRVRGAILLTPSG